MQGGAKRALWFEIVKILNISEQTIIFFKTQYASAKRFMPLLKSSKM